MEFNKERVDTMAIVGTNESMDIKELARVYEEKSEYINKASELQDLIEDLEDGLGCRIIIDEQEYIFDCNSDDGEYDVDDTHFREALIDTIKIVQGKYIKKFESVR